MKKKTLLIDIGNSNTLMAQYDDGKIRHKRIVPTRQFEKEVTLMLARHKGPIVIASVVPRIDKKIKKSRRIKMITYKNIPILKINIKKPNQVGADRMANALGAYIKYRKPCLIVGSGTAITFCYVDGQGTYHGGAIFPGMRIASQALNDYTAKIPLIWVKETKDPIGKTTEEAVKAGLYFGYIQLINGMIALYKKHYPESMIIGTGNGLKIIKDQINLDVYDPDLILKGLGVCADEI